MRNKFSFFMAIVLIAGALAAPVISGQKSYAQDPQDPPAGDPSVWTTRVCDGDAAVVWQSSDEHGDGVTLSTLNEEGCEKDDEMGWFVIEPWGGKYLNPDRACLAYTWQEVQGFTEVSGLNNGSAWRVEISEFESHILVLPCLSADGKDWQLGLNPNESQLDVRKLRGTLRLLDELLDAAGLTREDYLAEADEPLADNLRAVLEAGDD